jgi:hypothetical protein
MAIAFDWEASEKDHQNAFQPYNATRSLLIIWIALVGTRGGANIDVIPSISPIYLKARSI